MTDKNDAADIAWMRKLAEEGATAPFRGASILMAAGLIFGAASVLHWSVVNGLVALPPVAFSSVWGVATLLFVGLIFIIRARQRRSEGVVTAANRAAGVAWSAVGFGIFFFGFSMGAVGYRSGDHAAMSGLLALIPSVVMVFYGMGWAVTGAMLKSRPLWWLAVASFLAAPLLGLLAGEQIQFLAYAGALFLLMALPGWMLMRQAGRA